MAWMSYYSIFDRGKAHAWPAHCFTDGLGSVRVVLVAIDLRFEKIAAQPA